MGLKSEKCSLNELQELERENKLELCWEMAANTYKILKGSELVALIDVVCNGMFGNGTLEIQNFEVIEKNKGLGKFIIQNLINEINGGKREIYLYANGLSSKRFWINMGFSVTDDGSGTEILKYPMS